MNRLGEAQTQKIIKITNAGGAESYYLYDTEQLLGIDQSGKVYRAHAADADGHLIQPEQSVMIQIKDDTTTGKEQGTILQSAFTDALKDGGEIVFVRSPTHRTIPYLYLPNAPDNNSGLAYPLRYDSGKFAQVSQVPQRIQLLEHENTVVKSISDWSQQKNVVVAGTVCVYSEQDYLRDGRGNAIIPPLFIAYPIETEGEGQNQRIVAVKNQPIVIDVKRPGQAEIIDTPMFNLYAQGYKIVNPQALKKSSKEVVFVYHREDQLEMSSGKGSLVYNAFALDHSGKLIRDRPIELEVYANGTTQFKHKLADGISFQGSGKQTTLQVNAQIPGLYQAILNLEKAGLLLKHYAGSSADFMAEYAKKAAAINALAEKSRLNAVSLGKLDVFYNKTIQAKQPADTTVASKLKQYAERLNQNFDHMERRPNLKIMRVLRQIDHADKFATELIKLTPKELTLLSDYLFMVPESHAQPIARGYNQIMMTQLMQGVAYQQLIAHAHTIRGRMDHKAEAIDQVNLAMSTALKNGDLQQCINTIAQQQDAITQHSSGKNTFRAGMHRFLFGEQSTSERYFDTLMKKLTDMNGGQGPMTVSSPSLQQAQSNPRQ